MLERIPAFHQLMPGLLSCLGPSTGLVQANNSEVSESDYVGRKRLE
jgi:hypothetical protein